MRPCGSGDVPNGLHAGVSGRLHQRRELRDDYAHSVDYAHGDEHTADRHSEQHAVGYGNDSLRVGYAEPNADADTRVAYADPHAHEHADDGNADG